MTTKDSVSSPPFDSPGDDSIIDRPFDSALSERYLIYALSTITARSLPDLRDGMKPVHRRLLWAMRQLKLDPSSGFKKSARVVGDVIGKYHPHGDASVYDAMVRLAQDFALRYPLVEGQGNFGNIDGDNAAAYRYTEARLTKTAIQLIAGVDEGAVDFVPTYNGEEEEPEIFPGLFPNLLANGASGIAVGMATNIPSHNLTEIIDAALLLIDNPEAEHSALMDLFHGPDFPTGGVLVDGPEIISAAYHCGKGSLRVRGRFSTHRLSDGRWEASGVERLPGGGWQLVISEIPYMVQKSKFIEQVAQLIISKKLPILDDIRDESDEVIRIVLVPKSRNVEPELLKESLFRLTDLEIRFALNLNVLNQHRAPGVLPLKFLLQEWLASQTNILLRRTRYQLDRIAARIELLEGYLVAYLNLDRVIEIIRTKDEPKPVMIDEFSLTDRQAEAILNMRLRSLRKLEEMELRGERDDLQREHKELEGLLEDDQQQRARLKKDLEVLRRDYSPDTPLGRRRTTIVEQASPKTAFSFDAMIEKAPLTVILSAKGWIRGASGHEPEGKEFKFKEGDGPAFAIHAQTTDKLLLACDNGRFYCLGADRLPSARGFGEPLRTMLEIDAGAEIIALMVYNSTTKLLLASDNGRGFIANSGDILAETRKGRGVMNLKAGTKLVIVRPVSDDHDHLAIIGNNRKLVVFSLDEVPVMTKGQGVMLQCYREGMLSDVATFKLVDGLSWRMRGDSGRVRTESEIRLWKAARGAAGRTPPSGFPKDNKF